ncbi:hypothetical protein TNCV_952311 [Trichonephila clavipes]|nr:hypothetical protein TNCV_952311 [Trichonephila clavipes]
MFDSSSYVNPTPLPHADASRDVFPREGRIAAYRESGLVFCDIEIQSLACNYGINGMLRTILNDMQNPYYLPRLTSKRTAILGSSVLQKWTAISRTIIQKMDVFTARPATPQKNGDSGASNGKTGNMSSQLSSKQMSLDCAYIIPLTVYVSGGSDENACSIFAFNIGIAALYLV